MVDEATALQTIDENLQGIDQTVEESTAAQDMADQWNTAMGTLTADMASGIVGIFFGEGSPLGKLGNAFKEFGKGALTTIVATLIAPLQEQFEKLAKWVADKFSSLIFDGVKSGITDAVSETVGGAGGKVVLQVGPPVRPLGAQYTRWSLSQAVCQFWEASSGRL